MTALRFLPLLFLAAACASGDRRGPPPHQPDFGLPADASPPVAARAGSPSSTEPPEGRIPGSPRHPDDFARATFGCRCSETMDACRCLHCQQEPGAACYCEQGEPSCLCGIDMPDCRCTHCAGREGGGICPCDHSETRAATERAGDPGPRGEGR